MKIGNSRTGQILAPAASESAANAQYQRFLAAASNASAIRSTTTESLWPVAQNSTTVSGDQAYIRTRSPGKPCARSNSQSAAIAPKSQSANGALNQKTCRNGSFSNAATARYVHSSICSISG